MILLVDFLLNAMIYSFLDRQALKGNNYYRIKTIHSDGTHRLNNTQKVDFDLDLNKTGIFPNPAKTALFVHLKNDPNKSATVVIYNSLGIQMDQKAFEELPEQPIQFDVNLYPSGVYFVSIFMENSKRKTLKFVVSRL